MKDKIDEINELTVTKFENITKEINKVKSDIINKKFEGIQIKDDKILDNLKEKINEFMESNNKIADENKINHKKDIENIDKQIKEKIKKLNNDWDNKIEKNLNNLKINFEKIEKDFKNQNDINSNHEKSLEDIKNKINNNKLII